MAYPILASGCTWFTQGGTSVKRASITQINIVNGYSPTGSETSSWDASASKNGSIMCYVTGTVLTIAGNGSGKIACNADSKFAFSDSKAKDLFSNVVTINGLSKLDMSGVSETNAMFYSCKALMSLTGIEDWNMSNCITLRQIFRECNSLSEAPTGKWNTSNVTSLQGMFLGCASLKKVECGGWDTSKCTDMEKVVSSCSALEEIDVSGWDTSKVTNMWGTFRDCNALTALDVSGWDTSNVTQMNDTFKGCRSLKTLDVSGWDTSKVTTMRSMFSSSVDYGREPTSYEELDVSGWDTSSCTDMGFMFYGVNSLGASGNKKGVDLSRWDVSKVKDFDHFIAHSYMTIGDISGWKNTVVENLDNAFHSCRNAVLDVRGLKTSNCKTFGGTFKQYGSNLVAIPGVEDFDTSSAVDFTHMFYGCDKIEELDLFKYDFRSAKDGIVTSANESVSATCREMFHGMTSLKKISFGPNFRKDGDGSTTNSANHAVLPEHTNVSGEDAVWYDINRAVVNPTDIPDGEGVYYLGLEFADKELGKQMFIKQETLIHLAKAVRERSGTSNRYSPVELAEVIRSII